MAFFECKKIGAGYKHNYVAASCIKKSKMIQTLSNVKQSTKKEIYKIQLFCLLPYKKGVTNLLEKNCSIYSDCCCYSGFFSIISQ